MIFIFLCTTGQPQLPVCLLMIDHHFINKVSSFFGLNLSPSLLVDVVHHRIPLAAYGRLRIAGGPATLISHDRALESMVTSPGRPPLKCGGSPQDEDCPDCHPLLQGPRKLERSDQPDCPHPGLHHLGPADAGGLWQPHHEPPGPPCLASLNQLRMRMDGQG